jgi:hypothetical protein
MLNRSLPRSYLNVCLAIAVVAGSFFAASTSLSAAPPAQAAMFADLGDTGKIVPLRVGQQLVVRLPMRDYADNTWHVTKISPSLKLVAGPDELRPLQWSPWTLSLQVFYFQRESAGTVDLVLEPNYFSKPMILKVVDR